MTKPRLPWLRLVLLWFAGADLRITLLVIPPLMPLIHRDLRLDETMVAMLLGLPVLLMAVAATLGSMLISHLDARRALIAGIAAIAISSALRGVGPSIPVLFGMTLLMGASVAVSQPALPALVFYWAPEQIGLATAIYTGGLLMGEMFGAGLTTQVVVPLAGGWRAALALWALVPLATALAIWLLTPAIPGRGAQRRANWWPDYRNSRTWRLGLIQAGTSIVYWGTNTFLPDYLHSIGAGKLTPSALFLVSAGQVPASLLLTFRSKQFTGRSAPIRAMGLVAGLGLAIFFIPHDWSRLLGASILGFSSAFVFILNLAFPPLLARDADEVHRMSAGMFTIGYGLTFLMPLIGGAVWDRTGIAWLSLAPLVVGILCFLIAPSGLSVAGYEL
jgi:MFS transporter, CP family, cyanate transporter